ncbi:MAG: hypothetical protein NVS9B1_24680 [Candidatus Dormibacteraceae bacterium]
MPRRLFAIATGVAAAAAAAMFLTAAEAMADAAPPFTPGDPLGVPSGAVQDVFIEHEDLSMDLSGVNISNPEVQPLAAILATYALRNDGVAKGIDLIFVTASRDVSGVEVAVDGVPVAAKLGPLGPVPASWRPPNGTPALQPGPDLPYQLKNQAGLAFHIDLGSGRHTMVTRYHAVPMKNSGDAEDAAPVWWQLAFVLSPARQWKGFGDLDVSVRVPSGWSAAVRPRLTRLGDVLSGHFSGIPEDSIGVTTRMPLPPDWRSLIWTRGLVGVLIVSVILGGLGARLIAWPWTLAMLLAAPIFGVSLAIVVNFGEDLRRNGLPLAQQSWFGVRGVGLTSDLHVLTAFVIGCALGLFGLSFGVAAAAARRAKLGRTTG